MYKEKQPIIKCRGLWLQRYFLLKDLKQIDVGDHCVFKTTKIKYIYM